MKAEWQEQLVFTNDFKIRFCNGYNAVQDHAIICLDCSAYLRHGDGDLCEQGKKLIARAMVLQYESK